MLRGDQTSHRDCLLPDITVYDAAFVAMAEHLGTDFITADEKLVQRLQNISYVHYLADLALLEEK